MTITAGLGEYILLTHNTNNFEDSMGVERPSPNPFLVSEAIESLKS